MMGIGGWLTDRIPVDLSEKMAATSVKKFSAAIGHDVSFSIDWA
jgi:hypothetical protein